MKLFKSTLILSATLMLSACALTPEQKAEKEAQRVRAEQKLQVELAKQCDTETAELMHQKFNPPLDYDLKAQRAFDEKYVLKVNEPVFQACYKLAWQNYLAQQALRDLRFYRDYYWDDFRYRRFFCHTCW